MRQLELVPGSEEWIAAGLQYHRASEAPIMMGVSRHVKRNELLAAHALGNMAQRQKAHAFILRGLRNDLCVATNGIHQTRLMVHGAFRLARGTRGINQNCQVLWR